MVRTNQSYVEDRPIQIEGGMSDARKFSVTQDNVDALWSKVGILFNETRQRLRSTDDLREGSVNLYYTDAKVKNLLGGGTIPIVPAGVSPNQDVYSNAAGALISAGTIYITSPSWTLEAAIAELGAVEATVVVNIVETLTGNLTIPTNISLKINEGGLITGAFNLTINGYFEAGDYQTFGVTTTVTFGVSSGLSLRPEFWGAVRDGVTDDYVALQACIVAAETGVTRHVMKLSRGTYLTTQNLTITDTIKMKGEGRGNTVIVASGGAIDIVLDFPHNVIGDTGDTLRSEILDMHINGGSVADYGILGYVNHCTFRNLLVAATNVAAMDISYGWNNYFEKLEIQTNNGDGFRLGAGSANNSCTMISCAFFNNTGFGVVWGEGVASAMYNCTIEGNLEGGMFLPVNVRGFTIDTCYFEGNGGTGHDFTSPENITISADIIINGAANQATIAAAFTCSGSITNCGTHGDADYFIYGPGASAVSIENNRDTQGTSILFGTYGTNRVDSATMSFSTVNKLRIGINDRFSSDFNIDPVDYAALRIIDNCETTISSVQSRNIAETDMGKWVVVGARDEGAFVKSAEIFPYDENQAVYELELVTPGDSAHIWGFDFDTDNQEALDGKYFLWSAWVKNEAIDTIQVELYANGGLVHFSAVGGAGTTNIGWKQIHCLFVMPSVGNAIDMGFTRDGNAAGKVYICCPVLTEFGSDMQKLLGEKPPQEGTFVEYDAAGNAFIAPSGVHFTPDGLLHIQQASAGAVTAAAGADTLTLENNGVAGLSILTPDASLGSIYFGSPSLNNAGRIEWKYDDLLMNIKTAVAGAGIKFFTGNNSEALHLDLNQNATFASDIYLSGPNKELRFYEGANYVGFEAGALAADQIWVLPLVDGAAGTVLSTNGAGTLSWAAGGAIAAPGADTEIVWNNAGVLGAEAAFTYDDATNIMTVDTIAVGSVYASGASLLIQDDAAQNVEMFASAAGGETPTFQISGFRNVDAKRTLSIGISAAGNDEVEFTGLTFYTFEGNVSPATSDGGTLGTAAWEWSDLYLADGAVIYGQDDSSNTLTSGAGGWTTALNFSIGGSNNELRFYEGANYVGFEAPALAADQIWVLPAIDGANTNVLQTNGAGVLSWVAAGAGGGITIGDAIAGGAANLVLYEDAANDLAETAGFSFDGADTLNIPTGGSYEINSINAINLDGTDNVIVGPATGNTANRCIFIGKGAGLNNASNDNIAIGVDALDGGGGGLTLNHSNIAIGQNAMGVSTEARYSIVIGKLAASALTTGDETVAIGYQALAAITTQSRNVAIGFQSQQLATGTGNVSMGYQAAYNLSGSYNFALGQRSLNKATASDNCVAVGVSALKEITGADASDIVGIGLNAALNKQGGSDDVYIGSEVAEGVANYTSEKNTAIGFQAAWTSGDNVDACVIMGYKAGYYNVTADRLIIDNQIRADAATEVTNSIIHGDMAAAPANQTLRLNANVLVSQKIASGTLTLAAAGPTDNLDVSGVNTIFIDTSGNNVILGGTVGGVDGQILVVVVHDATNDTTIEDNEGTGNQDFVLHAGADETLTAEYGGWVFVNEGGTHWHDASHAKHV